MKLIIDIPELDYECAKQQWMRGNDAHKMDYYISKGIPLDDLKEQIQEEVCLTEDSYSGEIRYTIGYLKLCKILDNIGKENSDEEKA